MKHKTLTGILGGSFNPVHIGHLMLANYMAEFGGFDEVWLTLSPLNPLKAGNPASMASDNSRLKMLEIAVGSRSGKLKVCPVELSLPRPNYTIVTLDTLAREHAGSGRRFVPIIGGDNWQNFTRWRAWDEIISRYGVAVYPRPGFDLNAVPLPPEVRIVEAPTIEISSTFIRSAIAEGHDMTHFLPPGVFDYIASNGLYGYPTKPLQDK